MSFDARIAAGLLGACVLAGCSGLKTYPDISPRNLIVKTEATSGGVLSRTRVSVHIHEVDANCRTQYLGTVQLNEPTVEIGLPSDRLSFLEFSFYGSSFLGSSSGTISHDTLLRPRAGYTYDASARYTDGIYHVVIRESGRRGKPGREIARRSLAECNRRS